MDIPQTTLSDAIKQLLSTDNKDKSLGEVSEELNEYIIKIKDLVYKNEIDLEELKEEISKNLNKDQILPGSIAQLLVGCVDEEGACPMQSDHPEDVSFAYSQEEGGMVPLSNYSHPVTDKTYAVLWLTGDPKKIKMESLKGLEKKGFKRLKIQHKNIDSANYNVINIENLKRYINEKSNDGIYSDFMIMGFILLLIVIIYNIGRR
jgi:hypothetical protein